MSGLTVEKIVTLLKEFAGPRSERIEITLVGGLAMSFYGGSRLTTDIDAEVACSRRTYDDLTAYLSSQGIVFNLGEDISRWGIVPMPEGYRERTRIVHESRNLAVRILDPADFVFAKLRRGTSEDLSDIKEVLSRCKITKSDLEKRFHSIQLPKDIESSFFARRYERLLQEIAPAG